jgi:hypothetical protein
VELRERTVVARTHSRAVRSFAALVGAAALGAALLLAIDGAAWPPPGPVLLLSLVLLLAVNRFALFPNEHAATAEAAVLLAAVVGFRADAAFLGPLVLALLVGPLDMLHWTQRSFLRMAYNAGNRGLATLAAAGAFAATSDTLAGSPGALTSAVAAVVAIAAFAVVDLALSATLLRLQGEPVAVAVRDVLGIDVLTVPIAAFGAACGFLEPAVGWWAIAVALVPAVFVPEVVLARRRGRVAVVRDVAVAVAVLGTVAALAVFGPRPPLGVLAVLAALAAIVGTAFACNRWRVPPLLALLVTAAAVVPHDRSAFLVAVVTGLVGAVAAAWARGRVLPHAFVLVLVLVGAAVAVVIVRSSSPAPPGVALGSVLAGVVFSVITVLPSGAPGAARRLVWAAPVLAGAIAWAVLWRVVGTGGALAFAVGLGVLVAATAWWGPVPWTAPPALRRTGTHVERHLLAVLVTTALVSLVAVLAALVTHDDTRTVLAWFGVATGETALAMALAGIGQWRFAPRARVATLVLLLAVGMVVVAVVPTLAVDGDVLAIPVHVLCLAVIVRAGIVPAARTREVSTMRARR